VRGTKTLPGQRDALPEVVCDDQSFDGGRRFSQESVLSGKTEQLVVNALGKTIDALVASTAAGTHAACFQTGVKKIKFCHVT